MSLNKLYTNRVEGYKLYPLKLKKPINEEDNLYYVYIPFSAMDLSMANELQNKIDLLMMTAKLLNYKIDVDISTGNYHSDIRIQNDKWWINLKINSEMRSFSYNIICKSKIRVDRNGIAIAKSDRAKTINELIFCLERLVKSL